jgi:MoaA/NifB/PqqE/SkfB family radical SAM enzyme
MSRQICWQVFWQPVSKAMAKMIVRICPPNNPNLSRSKVWRISFLQSRRATLRLVQPQYDGVLQIEPTDLCNLSCTMCAPHHEGWDQIHGVPKGRMELAMFERIIDGLVADDCRFDHIIFQWLGDPSLHPDLDQLLRVTAERMAGRVGYLRVDTNAIVLTPDRMDGLLDAVSGDVPMLMVFTLDAHSPETYTRVKGQDALARVRKHIRHLVRQRGLRGVPVNVQLQFVVQEANAHEARDFLDYWADLLACQGGSEWHDEIMFKRLSVGGGTEGQAAADALYDRAMTEAGIAGGKLGHVHVQTWTARPWQVDDGHTGERTACPGLWITPVIRHDGHLMMCCADLGGELDLGSLHAHSFRELWEGPEATQRRLDHIAGRFEGVCAGCGGINWYQTTPEMVDSARKRAAVLGL